MRGAIPPPPYGFMAWYLVKDMISHYGMCLVKHRVNFTLPRNRGSWISTETKLRAGRWGFDFRQGLYCFLFATASRPVLGPIQPPIQWSLRAISPEVRQPGREADNSPPFCAEVKNEWSYTSTPPSVFMVWYWSTGTTLPYITLP